MRVTPLFFFFCFVALLLFGCTTTQPARPITISPTKAKAQHQAGFVKKKPPTKVVAELPAPSIDAWPVRKEEVRQAEAAPLTPTPEPPESAAPYRVVPYERPLDLPADVIDLDDPARSSRFSS